MKDKTKDIQPVQENIPQAELLPIGNTGQTLQKAKETAQLLKHIVEKAHLVIKIGASEHLKFEAWQFLGAAYGFTPKIIKTWWDDNAAYAEAVVIRLSDGMEVSKAVASCSKFERNWRNKDKFQIMSMAQTRAASKALRMVLSWVVVLAGYAPTPAEEITQEAVEEKATHEQRKAIFAIAREKGISELELRYMINEQFGTEHTRELTKQQASQFISYLQSLEVRKPETSEEQKLFNGGES